MICMYSAGDARVRVGPGLGLRVQSHGLIGEDMDSRTIGRQNESVRAKRDQICSAYCDGWSSYGFLKIISATETFMC